MKILQRLFSGLPIFYFEYIRCDLVRNVVFSNSSAVLDIYFVPRRKFGCVVCFNEKFMQNVQITDCYAIFKDLHDNRFKHTSHPL